MGGTTPGDGCAKEGQRRRLDPESRRAEVLQAALEVFTQVGFERATLQDVCERAGCTKGGLYHYFESKDQLFLELMRERLARRVAASDAVLAAAGPGDSGETLLRALLEVTWDTLQQPDMLDLSRLMVTELPKFPELGRIFFDELVAPSRGPMRQVWETGGRRRRKSALALADALAVLLPRMMFGAALTNHVFREMDPDHVDAGLARDVVREVLVRGALAVMAEAEGR